jgi:CRP-like cAMP-binding protein
MANQKIIKLNKGDVLFNEGDKSEAMYYIQSGAIRLFKKKGQSFIELGILRQGEVLGEMGFLDGGPRSASAEALYTTEVVEVNSTQMAQQLKQFPQWLSILLKTIVQRLRKANETIRQLEASSTTINYSGDGSSIYEFLNHHDVIKISTAMILCAVYKSQKTSSGFEFPLPRLIKYANQVMGVPQAKISELIDGYEKIGIAKINRANPENVIVTVGNPDFIEIIINFITEENTKTEAKKIKFSSKALVVMETILKHISKFPPDKETNLSEINIMGIINAEKLASGGKEPFKIEDFSELVTQKMATEIQTQNKDIWLTKLNPYELAKMYKIQKFLKEVERINELKRTSQARKVR